MHELGGRRSGYQSPEAVLAEARRMAADIKRGAERDAATIRREAAEWAAGARAEAERHRQQILDDLARLEAATTPTRPIPEDRIPEDRVPEDLVPEDLVPDDPVPEDPVDDEPLGQVIDLRPAPPAPETGGESIETSIETKVHDVVRLALRRTFERRPTGTRG